jgi:hypothetical protein
LTSYVDCETEHDWYEIQVCSHEVIHSAGNAGLEFRVGVYHACVYNKNDLLKEVFTALKVQGEDVGGMVLQNVDILRQYIASQRR